MTNNVSRETMKEELVNNCPICNSERQSVFLKCKDELKSKKVFQIVKCNDCGFKFTNPRPTENKAGFYYQSDDYVSHSNTDKGLINKIYKTVRNYSIKKKFELISEGKATGSVLDYGCGTGEVLAYCKSKGWKTLGVEPDEIAAKRAKQTRKINILLPSQLNEIKSQSKDAISLWHVMEHVYQLKPTLQHLKRILKQNGQLIIAVPNCNSKDAKHYKENWAAYDLPRHIYHFTPKDVDVLANELGFNVTKTLPMIFDSFYISMMSEQYKGGSNISAFFNGLFSNINSMSQKGTCSSQIYILKLK